MTKARWSVIFLAAAMLGFGGTAYAAPPTCAALTTRYDQSNKELSAIYAAGVGDDSAPRESNRQMRMLNERIIQSMTISMMVAGKCTLPSEGSDEIVYLTPALTCATAQLKSDKILIEDACDRSKWQSMTEADRQKK